MANSSGAAEPLPGRVVDSDSATSLQSSPVRCWIEARRTSPSFGTTLRAPVVSRAS